MIAASKQRYLPTIVNTMVLSKNGWYFYLHRDVYDQAVVLSDKHEQSPDELSALIGGNPVNMETVRWFGEQTPRPLHILAPFLQLIDGEVEQDIEMACGVLHVITSMIQVRKWLTKPQEIRKSVSFSLTIKEEYELAWESFFASAIPYDQRGQLLHAAHGMSAPPPVTMPVGPDNTVPLLSAHAPDRFGLAMEPAPARIGPSDEERTATRSLLLK